MAPKLPRNKPTMADVIQRETPSSDQSIACTTTASSSLSPTFASSSPTQQQQSHEQQLHQNDDEASSVRWLEPTYTLLPSWQGNVDRAMYIELRKITGTNEVIARKKVRAVASCVGRESLRELRIANLRVVHPNIVRYYACFAPNSNSSHTSKSSTSSKSMGNNGGKGAAFSSSSSSSSSPSKGQRELVEVHIHMEYAERLCLARFCEDLWHLVERNKVLNQGQRQQYQHHPRSHAAARSFTSSSFLSGGGQHEQHPLNRLIETCLKSVARQALCGLVALHQVYDTIHRDIKPGNLLLKDCGLVKLTDFGTAIPDPVDTSATATGTARYQAPEMHAHKSVAKTKVDVWSLGATLLYMKLRCTYGLHEEQWPEDILTLDQTLKTIRLLTSSSSSSSDKKPASSSSSQATQLNHQQQQQIDTAVAQSFSDVGLRHLVSLMLRIDPEKRVFTRCALAWSFALTPAGCNALLRSSCVTTTTTTNEKQQPTSAEEESQSAISSFSVGWPSSHAQQTGQRNFGAERQLQEKFGVVPCDEVLHAEMSKISSSATATRADLEHSVEKITDALSVELAGMKKQREVCVVAATEQRRLEAAAGEEHSSSTSANFTEAQRLMNEVLSRRHIEQVRMLQEVLAMTPPVREG